MVEWMNEWKKKINNNDPVDQLINERRDRMIFTETLSIGETKQYVRETWPTYLTNQKKKKRDDRHTKCNEQEVFFVVVVKSTDIPS